MRFLSRFGFAALIVLALAGGAYAYRYLRLAKKPGYPAVALLPAGPLVYAETSDIQELNARIGDRSLAVDALRGWPAVNGFCRALAVIDSLASAGGLLQEQLAGNMIHLAVYGDSSSHWVFAFALKTMGDAKKAEDGLFTLFPGAQRTTDGYLSCPVNGHDVLVKIDRGVVCVSDARELLNATGTPVMALDASPQYKSFRSMHPVGELFSFYIDNALYAAAEEAGWPRLPLRPPAGVTAGHIDAGPSELRINGFVTGRGDPLGDLVSRQPPGFTSDILAALPGHAACFTAWAVDSLGTLVSAETAEASAFWQVATDSAMYSVRPAFYANCTQYLAVFARNAEGMMAVTALRDTVAAREHLAAMRDSVLPGSITISRLYGGIALFGENAGVKARYSFIWDGKWYAGERHEDMAVLALALRGGHVLSNDPSFVSYASQQMPERFHYLCFVVPRNVPQLAAEALQPGSALPEKMFADFSRFNYSIVRQDGLRARLHLQYSPRGEERRPATNMLWTATADTSVVRQPEIFRNHLTGEKEIVVQDAANGLYLFTAKGERLWKKEIGEPILSEIFMVDAYKNGKLQLLFNTAGLLHLVDRNGRYVEGFPVKLPAPATAGINVFDYERNRDYRVLVPCADKRIYNYTVGGKRIAEFASPTTETPVKLPLQYVNAGGREYLVAVDSGGKIYTFNRRGEPRGSLSNRVTEGCAAFYADAGGNAAQSFVMYVDERDGLLHKVSLTDKKQVIKLTDPVKNGSCRFAHADKNRFMDVIISAGTQVAAFDLAGNRLFAYDMPVDVDDAGTFERAGGRGVYAFGRQHRMLCLSDNGGSRVTTYPASSPPLQTDLFSNKQRYLVFGENNLLHCLAFR